MRNGGINVGGIYTELMEQQRVQSGYLNVEKAVCLSVVIALLYPPANFGIPKYYS